MAHTAYLYVYYTFNKQVCQYHAQFSTKINSSSLGITKSLCKSIESEFLIVFYKDFSRLM